ncbi:UNVERIFIED_CONTAM: hypothetical protein GTU68_027289 [Idotea baltica]|nr:hypothetical protein [Idotea baltica]
MTYLQHSLEKSTTKLKKY